MQHLAKIPSGGQYAIARRLASARRRSGLNQADFATALGFAKRSYLSWERMESEPPLALLEALTRIFDVDANWLLLGPGDEPRYLHDASAGRFLRVRAAIQAYATDAGVVLPLDRIDGLALSVTRQPVDHEAIILQAIRETVFLEAGRAP